ncbi:Dihydropteroate synthase [Baekduia alba]|uniref:dihydropteroate synthase n=1 Tax=Baekduia alba TaxID=2997333 RepID=UPI00233FB441|nr:dihydropteroate synthase [Baekduia alba]WCB93626.1 Dihydropteroate synthase [Baekduia alba]
MTAASARRLTLRDRRFDLRAGRPLVMGIVNANPDSFSDAVRTSTLDAQVALAVRLVEEGADLVDVGGESGVTYTDVTAAEVERDRVVPLVARLVAEGIVVSVDTWKPLVADAALDAGAHVLNDVSGLRDVGLARAAARTGASLVVMHTRAAPKQEHFADYDGDVVGDVEAFVRERCAAAVAAGVAADRLIVDPGPDFAKSPAESVATLRAIDRLGALGHPWLAAVSRKYFLAAITGRPPAQRLAGTLAAVGFAADRGAAIVRVHDVAEAVDYLAVREVLHGGAEVGAFDADDDALKWIRATPSS